MTGCDRVEQGPSSKLLRVAHAGGSYQGQRLTNSLEALDFNKHDYTYFEIDLAFTKDQELVCIHDWSVKTALKNGFNIKPSWPPTLAEFEYSINQSAKLHNCTFSTLVDWLKQNPDKKIITDIKTDNLQGLTYIASRYQNFAERFIVQIYDPDEYDAVKQLGYKEIILTLYRYDGDDEAVISAVTNKNYMAVTIPRKRATSLAHQLKKINVPTYVHIVNTHEQFLMFQQLGATEIYTDKLPVNQAL